ncbi:MULTISPECIES: hypothetical protein [Bacillus]|uniref:hypothetical protein n=1 Tax=Bacillus TaxID=1386 RepID=UPI001581945B|nr:hypothetical protein [Bacillus glycinifermentans]MBU8786146.1 hypothetical protein [Bacillus glycinifermentans]NUJ16695.1 hypothetical protein [Bacillus glycinifermentans]
MAKRILVSSGINVLIFIIVGIFSLILYAVLSFFFMQSFATGEPSQDEALGWGYLGFLFISIILAILTGIIGGVISFCICFKKFRKWSS